MNQFLFAPGALLAAAVGFPIFPLLVALLCVSGTTIAALFVLATYRIIPREALQLPVLCDPKSHACGSVLDTTYARTLFGVPNALFGVGFYALLFVWALLGMPGGVTAYFVALTLTALAFAFSAFLAFALLVRLKMACRLCFVSHVLNTCLLGVLLARLFV